MSRTFSDNFYNKVNFIYSNNKKTPLFVSKAFQEIKNKNVNSAIDILINGITAFPNFAAAYLLLGKAFALNEDYNLAIENIKKGSDLIHSKKTYDFYLNEIEIIKKRKSLGGEEIDDSENDDEENNLNRNENKFSSRPLPIDDSLEDLVKELSSDKLEEPKKNKSGGKSSGETVIISETLAKIYSAQGGYQEAIEVYEKLKEKYPDKIPYYTQKIEELKLKLD